MKESLYKSAMRGDIELLEKVLKECSIEEINEKEQGLFYSTLALAVSEVQVESVKLLLKYGADPNSEDRNRRTPLFYVGEEQPVDIDTPDKRFEIAQLLLNAGADINHSDESNNQPLWTAVFYTNGEQDLPLIKLFLDKGADVNHKNKANRSPLDFAKQVNYSPLIELLEKKK